MSIYLYVDSSGVVRDKTTGNRYMARGANVNNFTGDLTEGHTDAWQNDRDPTTGSNYPNTSAGKRKAVIRRLQDAKIGFIRGVMNWQSLENTSPRTTSATGFISLPQSNLFHSYNDTGLRAVLQAIDDANAARTTAQVPIRVLLDVHATGTQQILGETPSWFMSGGTEASAERAFFSNRFSVFDGTNASFGAMPTGLPQYNMGANWGPYTLWTETLKWLATLSSQYECIVAIDTFNEPSTDWDADDASGTRPGLALQNIAFRNFCRFAADRIWRINPNLLVSPENSIQAREPPKTTVATYRDKKPVVFDHDEDWIYNGVDVSVAPNPPATDRFTPQSLGLGTANQGGMLFQHHFYPNHDGTITRASANSEAKGPKRVFKASQKAGQGLLIGEHSFYAQCADDPLKQYNRTSSTASAQTLLFSNWDDTDAASAKEGFCDWVKRNGVLATHWAFLRSSWGIVIADSDTDTATPAPGNAGYPARELKKAATNNFDAIAALDATVNETTEEPPPTTTAAAVRGAIATRCVFSGRAIALEISNSERSGAEDCWFNGLSDERLPGTGAIAPWNTNTGNTDTVWSGNRLDDGTAISAATAGATNLINGDGKRTTGQGYNAALGVCATS